MKVVTNSRKELTLMPYLQYTQTIFYIKNKLRFFLQPIPPNPNHTPANKSAKLFLNKNLTKKSDKV